MRLLTKLKVKIERYKVDKQTNQLLDKLNNPRRIWKTWEHKFWGDSLYILGPLENYRMEGFGYGYKIGDELQIDNILPGYIVVGYIVNIKYENNPKDLFRITWQPIGYLHKLKRYDKYNRLEEKRKPMFLK